MEAEETEALVRKNKEAKRIAVMMIIEKVEEEEVRNKLVLVKRVGESGNEVRIDNRRREDVSGVER